LKYRELSEKNYIFSQLRLQQVQDMFIFCCYTGLAYQEMSALTEQHIKIGFDGNLWIEMYRQKTKSKIAVPLLPKAKELLKQYNNELPVISNQKFNSYLKEIAQVVGINKRITHHTARKTFASTVLLYNDVPMEIVSELLGHSSIKITQSYYTKVVKCPFFSNIITHLTKKYLVKKNNADYKGANQNVNYIYPKKNHEKHTFIFWITMSNFINLYP